MIRGDEGEIWANDYNIGFGYWFIDSDMGCERVLWVTHERVEFCWGNGLWKTFGGMG